MLVPQVRQLHFDLTAMCSVSYLSIDSTHERRHNSTAVRGPSIFYRSVGHSLLNSFEETELSCDSEVD